LLLNEKRRRDSLLGVLGYLMPNNKLGGETDLPINRKLA